jgi:alanyl-tRNA synthetase
VGYGIEGGVAATIQAIMVDGERAETIEAGQKGEIVLDATPFYAEAGGQVGDTGYMARGDARARVTGTLYRGTTATHRVEMESGSFQVGDSVEACVDLEKRSLTMKNHTATHLLQAALRQVLGPHVKQAGSLVAPDRLRFDFTHYAPLTAAEIRRIEDIINQQIWRNVPVDTQLMDLDHAMKSGAMALFGEKYQEKVRVVEVPGFSKELCGGTHVPATGTIGLLKITGEGGISAGVRRIEAVTGPAAFTRFRSGEEILDSIQADNKIARQEVPAWIDRLQAQIRDLQHRILDLKAQAARANISGMLERAREIGGIKVVADTLPEMDRAGLRNLADELKQKIGSGVVVLGSPQEDKVALVVMVTSDICQKIPAGRIISRSLPWSAEQAGASRSWPKQGVKIPPGWPMQ